MHAGAGAKSGAKAGAEAGAEKETVSSMEGYSDTRKLESRRSSSTSSAPLCCQMTPSPAHENFLNNICSPAEAPVFQPLL